MCTSTLLKSSQYSPDIISLVLKAGMADHSLIVTVSNEQIIRPMNTNGDIDATW